MRSNQSALAAREKQRSFTLTVQADEYRSQPIPGFVESSVKLGDCFVRVTDLPVDLDEWMEVNPRVPRRTQKGVLSGPVIKGILETLRERPEDMPIKNQGIYLLVEEALFEKGKGGIGRLMLTFADPERHGIVNGGHTYAAIREAIDSAENSEIDAIAKAHVRLHILQGIEPDKVPDIAEGLNRSKQVDDPSLANLQGSFAKIKDVMRGQPGESAIAYHQGDDGDVYITDVLVFIEMFNVDRFDDNKHPYTFYRRPKTALSFFESDLNKNAELVDVLVRHLPEILFLSDTLRKETPIAAKRIGFEFGRMKTGKHRAGATQHRNTPLPFIGESMDHRVPNGWLHPMLAAFRANAVWNSTSRTFQWRVPLDELVPEVIDDLVRVCVTEHRDNNMQPELIGKRESAYRQCYDKVLLNLAKRGCLGS